MSISEHRLKPLEELQRENDLTNERIAEETRKLKEETKEVKTVESKKKKEKK